MKHFLASVALGAVLLGTAPGSLTSAAAETPDNQLIVAMSLNNVLTLDPAAITGRDTVQILNNVYDTLVELDPTDQSIKPRVAESWEVAEDNMSVTFHLRDDVTFASGNPLTAEDVAWSLEPTAQAQPRAGLVPVEPRVHRRERRPALRGAGRPHLRA